MVYFSYLHFFSKKITCTYNSSSSHTTLHQFPRTLHNKQPNILKIETTSMVNTFYRQFNINSVAWRKCITEKLTVTSLVWLPWVFPLRRSHIAAFSTQCYSKWLFCGFVWKNLGVQFILVIFSSFTNSYIGSIKVRQNCCCSCD